MLKKTFKIIFPKNNWCWFERNSLIDSFPEADKVVKAPRKPVIKNKFKLSIFKLYFLKKATETPTKKQPIQFTNCVPKGIIWLG